MLNKNDKKNMLWIIIGIAVILGIFILIRGYDQKQLEENNPSEPDTPIVEPDEPQPEESVEPEENTNQYVMSTPVVEDTIEEIEEDIYPEIDLDINYFMVSLGEEFQLPEISKFDQNGNPLTVSITYKFRTLGSTEFVPTLDFSTDRIGTYQITYHVENEKHYISEMDIYVDIVDDVSPMIDGMITSYDEIEDVTKYISVSSGSFINQSISLSFSDNDEVVYAEYYNAKLENIIEGDTIEQEAMPTVNIIEDLTEFNLSEEGEYHIRAYDRSGNYTEFVVTIDYTNPEIETITYQQNQDHTVLVTITFNEAILPIPGWELSEDQKVLTKIYSENQEEEVTFIDLAGNQNTVSVTVDQINIIHAYILQNNEITQSRNLNRNDGEIKVYVEGQANITYTLNDETNSKTYENNTVLTEDGYYHFTITDGVDEIHLEFYISSMDTND